MSGIELTIRLKQNPKALYIPVVVYYSDGLETRETAMKAGASLVIEQPQSYGALKRAFDIVLKPLP